MWAEGISSAAARRISLNQKQNLCDRSGRRDSAHSITQVVVRQPFLAAHLTQLVRSQMYVAADIDIVLLAMQEPCERVNVTLLWQFLNIRLIAVNK